MSINIFILLFVFSLVFYETRTVFKIEKTSLLFKILIFNPMLNKHLLSTYYTLGVCQ